MAPPGDWLGLQALIEAERRKQEIEAWQAAHPEVPPLPNFTESVTPVGNLKNQVALSNQYTPEAAQILYDTPTRWRIGDPETDTKPEPYREGMTAAEGYAGYYVPQKTHFNPTVDYGPAQIYMNANYGNPANKEILAHEFAHKWQDTQLPLDFRTTAWDGNARNVSNPYAVERSDSRSDGNSAEIYAHNAERGPEFIQQDVRNNYYPGLYQDEINRPMPPSAININVSPPEQMPSLAGISRIDNPFKAPDGWTVEGALRSRSQPGPWGRTEAPVYNAAGFNPWYGPVFSPYGMKGG